MRTDLVHKLLCPVCRQTMELLEDAPAPADNLTTIDEGVLRCKCSRMYPVSNGIPRLLPVTLEDKAQHNNFTDEQPTIGRETKEFKETWIKTQQSFGRQWLRYEVQHVPEDEKTFEAKTGFRLKDLKGLQVLDAGCGGGRYSYLSARSGAQVTAVDISRAVEKTSQLCSTFNNIDIIQASITQLPLKTGQFDRIYSIGVLHHTPNTESAFQALVPYLKPGGVIAIWVYPKWSATRETMNNFWRSITTRLPHPVVHAASVLSAPLGGARERMYRSKSRLLARVAWQTEKLLPGFSNHPDRRQRICDTFDWLTPQYQWHHTPEEVRGWFEAAGLVNIQNLAESAELVHPGQGEGVFFSGQRPEE